MFTQIKSFIRSNALLIAISLGGFLFSILIGTLLSKISNSIIFSLSFFGAIFFACLIYKDIYIGIGIFIGTMLFDYSTIPLFSQNASISKITGLLILGLCILKLLIERENLIPNDRKSSLIGLFFLWSLFSLLYVTNTKVGIARITTLFQLIMTYILIIKTIKNSKALTKILLTVTIIGILISVVSIIYMIKSPHILIQKTWGSIERYGGTNGDPNMFAQNFLVLLPFYLFFYLSISKIYMLAIITSIFVLLSTYSRGAFIGMTVVLLLSTIVIFQSKKRRLIFISLTASMLVISILFLNKSDALEKRLTSSGQGSSTQTRLELLEVALKMGMANYITGVGLGNFIEHSYEYSNFVHYQRESHNGFLDIFATLGLPGFIIFLYIIYLCIKDFWLGIKTVNSGGKELKNLIQFISISFISFLVTGFFLGLIYSKMFWVLVAFSSISKKIAENEVGNLKS